jgi:hypothetical protein
MGDIDEDRAARAAERVNRLTGAPVALPATVDASDHRALVSFLEPLDAFVSSASYRFNL